MTVIVYTQPNCPQCTMTKKHLTKRGVSYEELPMDEDARAQAAAAGITSAPVVLVEGKALWGGYRPDALDRLAC